MSTNIAINGMGRIGRMVLRIALQNKNLNVVAINASYPPETIAHLINYDTTHGKYNLKVEPIENGLQVGDHKIKLVADRNPENLPWKELDIDIAIDATGKFNGLMTTVHAITNDQKNIDNPHKDLRRARSCNESIIPTSTGAAKALKEVLPELEGKLHGMALRVPTKNVSLVDLVVDLEKEVTAEEVNQAFENAGLEGIIEVEHQPLVSVDFNTNPHSAIIDAKSTMVMSGNKVKVIAWYDNEWGYSNRVVDVAEQIGALLTSKETVSAS